MTWILAAAILGGLLSGFAAGASPVPTGGNVATAVAGLVVGVIGGIAAVSGPDPTRLDVIGRLAVVFFGTLLVSYIGANVLRKHGALEWMGISAPTRRP
jgi:phage shock protein PspC (stress-responsive transcriptional regulator)